jgi:hypothetical protein
MGRQTLIIAKTDIMKNILSVLLFALPIGSAFASSHREAPLIANDPLADNTDLYAFKSPNNPEMITIIANYVPMQIPHGGPNYYSFGQDIRYEIHIDNDATTTGDDIVYRFTFNKTNEDPTTFFNIRLGQQNLKTTYTMERSLDGGATFATVLSNGVVPPNNIGPRSIENSVVGLGDTYNDIMNNAVNSINGEKVFCGPVDDPFFVDLGGIFDLGDAPRQNGGTPKDALKCMNVSTIALEIPVSVLQKDGLTVGQADNILDGDYVIGVWASASRKKTRTLNASGGGYVDSDNWVQVSRIGMPLTNEAVMPIGQKDFWNSLTPYQELAETTLDEYFYNPELALYMDDDQFGAAVPAFAPLRVQKNSRPDILASGFDFSNTNDGLYPLKGSAAVAGTALDDAVFGTLLLPAAGKPRSVDLWPIFHTGVPNMRPYQLANNKQDDNPLAEGKPFINNFLPTGGDMLRLNMAVPATPRNSAQFSSLGLLQAAVLGLTNITYNTNNNLQFIPNMDGFPNGRRLEDDVTRIELQAVSGAVLAAIGMFYDDWNPPVLGIGGAPVTADFQAVVGYSTGIEANDVAFQTTFPFVAAPWRGTDNCLGKDYSYTQPAILAPSVGLKENTLSADSYKINAFPNPFSNEVSFEFTLPSASSVEVKLFTATGQAVSTVLPNTKKAAGDHTVTVSTGNLNDGLYFARVTITSPEGKASKLVRVMKIK